jgi:hypothetical protein
VSPRTLIVLAVGLVAVTIFGARFGKKQNHHKGLGGAISKAKQVWLSLAIFDWFVLAPAVALDPGTEPHLALGLGAFGAFMWIRGIAEMVMLYVTKNWRPPIGITHDALCILLLIGCVVWQPPELTSHDARWVAVYYGKVVVSLGVEIWYAWAFFDAVKGKTTGEEGVWFADEHDPKFKRINRVTATFNTIFVITIALFLLAINL